VSLAEAKTRGIPVIAYGAFINDVVNFVIVAFVIFTIVKQANRFKRPLPVAAAATKDCPFCMSAVPLAARRCAHCCADF
jgi:large conductance mechanosensitive channel